MGYIKREIKKRSKLEGSKSNARQIAEDWYARAYENRKNLAVRKTPQPFLSGKIYVFEYLDPVTPNLPWWDMHPVVLALDPAGKNDLGINLNLLPIPVKEQLLDDIYTRLEGVIKNAQARNPGKEPPLNITYQEMKNYLKRYGYDFAIRQYKRHIKKNQTVVSYSNWVDISLCDFIALNGKTVWHLKREFSEWFRKNNNI